MDADPRLVAGAGGAVRYMAETAGLEGDAAKQFQSAAVATCEEVFSTLTPEYPQLDIFLTLFEDRIEVAVSHQGDSDLKRKPGAIGNRSKHEVCGVDRIQIEQQQDASVTRLTKFFAPQT